MLREKTVDPGRAAAAGVRGEPTRSTNMRTERVIRPAPERDAMRRWHGRAEARPVHFLHVGKTGGTAFKHAVRAAPPPLSRYVIHLHPHRVVLRDVPEGERFPFFLRDPVTRFVSGFHSRQREGRPRYRTRWSPEERKAFERFPTPDALALSADDGEEDYRFLDLCREILRRNRWIRAKRRRLREHLLGWG